MKIDKAGLEHIAKLLDTRRKAQDTAHDANIRLMAIAVEALGISQDKARKLHIENFFDGFLAANGMMQKYKISDRY